MLCAAHLGSSSTPEITRQGCQPAWRYRKRSPQPWPCVTLVPGLPEQESNSTSSVSCQAQQSVEGCVQHPGPLLPHGCLPLGWATSPGRCLTLVAGHSAVPQTS